jgi:mono/diheme cytochrome c family protein
MSCASVHSLRILAIVIILAVSGRSTQSDSQQDKQMLEHGRYLVEAVAICFECHSERDVARHGWPIPPGRAGDGRILVGEGTRNQLVAPNITPDKRTGIGNWSDSDLMGALIGGVGAQGRPLNPEMPYLYFRAFSEYDLRSIIAYIKSIPPVSHRLPTNPPFANKDIKPAVSMISLRLRKDSPQIRRGEYLVRVGGCETCHTPKRNDSFIRGLEFAGGIPFNYRGQTFATSNLTPSVSGLNYTQDQFIEIMHSGKVNDRLLYSAMPWLFYGRMTDDDLQAVYAYLRALPPVDHMVDNSVPPTVCRKCGNRHGLGDKN